MSLSQEVRPPSGAFPGRSRWDVVVVGCGVMGAAVSYNLARRGLRVLAVERFGVNNERGSSHGRTRIIRLAYHENPKYVPLLRRAFDAWREIESKSGKRLLRKTGGLMIGKKDGDFVRGVVRSAKAHGLPYEALSASDANTRFEAFNLGDEFAAVHDPNAGVLSAEESVRAFVGLASEAGCEFRFSEEVKGWKSRAEGIELETSLGRQTTARVVLCAGAWNGALLRGVVPLQCERQVPLWFSTGGKERFTASKMPVFIMEEEKGSCYYGIPDVGHGVKAARHHGGEVSGPDMVKREVTEGDIAPVRAFISRRLKDLDGPPIESTTCIYSNTPDFDFVVGPHPGDQRTFILSACSGHGFKFASVLGEVVANLALGESAGFDISFLSPARFGDKKA